MTTTAMSHSDAKTAPAQERVDAPGNSSVMRQTQGVIGFVLLASVAAAYFVDFAWVVLPLVIGFGLVFAGASGMCPMALLMARMPWNKPAESNDREASGGCCGGRCRP